MLPDFFLQYPCQEKVTSTFIIKLKYSTFYVILMTNEANALYVLRFRSLDQITQWVSSWCTATCRNDITQRTFYEI